MYCVIHTIYNYFDYLGIYIFKQEIDYILQKIIRKGNHNDGMCCLISHLFRVSGWYQLPPYAYQPLSILYDIFVLIQQPIHKRHIRWRHFWSIGRSIHWLKNIIYCSVLNIVSNKRSFVSTQIITYKYSMIIVVTR